MNFDNLKDEWIKKINVTDVNVKYNLTDLDGELRSLNKKINNRDLWVLFQALAAIPFVIYFFITHSGKSGQELIVILTCLFVCLLSPCYYWSARKSGLKNLSSMHDFLQSEKVRLVKQIKITKYSVLLSIFGWLFIAYSIVNTMLSNIPLLPLVLVEIVGYWWYLKEMRIYNECKYLLKDVTTQLGDMKV